MRKYPQTIAPKDTLLMLYGTVRGARAALQALTPYTLALPDEISTRIENIDEDLRKVLRDLFNLVEGV